MSATAIVNGSRTQSIGTKVTPEDERRIKEFCDARDSDVSTMTRDIWLEKLNARSTSAEFFLLSYLVDLCEEMYAAQCGDQCEGDRVKIIANLRACFKGNSQQLLAERIAQAVTK